ncbi:peptidylprolyl isomerase [Porphyromonas circumdentaria]|uniref:peptidylprolyl isomerase n=1 Tax=Porphyromonas circumdentaria TaxID=29524 RepID=UPI0026DABA72|nr:peptidylprolyl isomerase [Porphyromonas circumdentaria]MDO4723080.1 SurA N-terminal domain-containing protein [Porphyromonas circumdentaria]
MATLEKIRNRAGLLIIVIGVALFAFIIGDGLRSGSTLLQLSKNSALVIDGNKINIEDYSQRLSEMQEFAESNGQKLTDEQRMELNNQLAQEYVQTIALENQTEALGVRVTPEELIALITGNGARQSYQAQQFFANIGVNAEDAREVKEFLNRISDASIKAMPAAQQGTYLLLQRQWNAIVRMITNERLSTKFSALMSRSFAINKIDSKYLSGVPSRDVAVVRTMSTVLADSTAVPTEQEIKDFYTKHPKMFEQKIPLTKVNYISVEVRPSAEDYAVAREEMEQLQTRLAQTTEVAEIARNYSESFAPEFYLTEKELDEINLSPSLVDFLKSSEIGAVNNPVIENDRYSLVKLVGKKVAPEAVYARIIVLDTVNTAKADSIVTAINMGSSFADLATLYSADPQTKAQGGYLIFPDSRTGAMDSTLTEARATQMGLDTLYKVPVGKAFAMEMGKTKFILQTAQTKPAVTKYRLAYMALPISFSDATFSEKYATINSILASEESFEKMAKMAEEKGLDVRRGVEISSFSSTLGSIPSSREIVSWALKGEVNDVYDKVFRCGDSHLVIASVAAQQPEGIKPLDEVREMIKDRLTVEKRGDKLAANLLAKNLNSIEAYAEEMQVTVDTLSGVSLLARGQASPMISAHSMSIPLNTVSKPFRSDYEVVVVKPLSETDKSVGMSLDAQLKQQRRALGQGLGYRAFGYLVNDLKVEDNRARFY